MAITVTQHRLHQADRDLDLSEPAARRQGPHRHAHARRGLRQPPVRRLDARLHHDLLGPRPRLLAQGSRDSGRRARRQGQVDRQPRVDGRGREDRRDARGEGVRGRQVRRDGHPPRRDQEDGALGVQQSARRRHHRDGRRRRRCGHRRAGDRRQGRDLHRHPQRDGDPVRGERRPADGPHAPTASAASPSATTITSWPMEAVRPGGIAPDRHRARATASEPSSRNIASSRAAASASSTSRRATGTARSSASPTSRTETSCW